ncbi:MAG: glycosyltransferase family 87 protein [Phototrophicales bacterium]|mgnify:CR=1 FL=1|nr:glycosyltransferase family 87 protein [Phototrophicales bacterium]
MNTLTTIYKSLSEMRRVWWGLVIFLWMVFIVNSWVLFTFADVGAFGRYDFIAYAKGAQALVDGISPYSPQFDQRHLYLYPPLLAQLLAPFIGILGEPSTASLWYWLNVGCIVGIILLMRRYTAPQHHIWLWVFPVIFFPITNTLYLGQVTIILAFLFMLTWHDYHQEKHIRAGMWLALACWIKVFPVFIVLYFILRRDWRVVRGVVIGGVALGIFQILVSGIDMMIEAFQVMLTLFAYGQEGGSFQNSSILGFASRLFTEHEKIEPLVVNHTLFQITRYGVMIFTIVMTYGISLWHGRDMGRGFDLGYGATLIMALLVGSTLWVTGMPPYFLVFWLVFRYSGWRDAGILMVSVIGLTLYLSIVVRLGDTRLPWWSLYAVGFYASYLLWALAIGKIARR